MAVPKVAGDDRLRLLSPGRHAAGWLSGSSGDADYVWSAASLPRAAMIAEIGTLDGDLRTYGYEDPELANDKPAGSPQQFRQRCMESALKRAMHHHVFDTSAGLQLIDYAGFAAIRKDRIKPHHIVVLSRRRQGPVDKGRSLTNYGGHGRSARGFCG